MIGEPGTAEGLARLGPRFPLMPDDRIVYFGYEPNGGPCEESAAERHGMARYPAERVRGRPEEAAAEALGDLASRAERFVVHFDVDAIDFLDFPVADVPQHNRGLSFREAISSLGVFARSPAFTGFLNYKPARGQVPCQAGRRGDQAGRGAGVAAPKRHHQPLWSPMWRGSASA